MPNSNDGLLVTVEGIDKAGKTTVVSAIKEALVNQFDRAGVNRNVVVNTEPDDGEYGYGNDFGVLTREKLSEEDVHPLALFHSFEADHHQHVKDVVEPALQEGDVVILDRYLDSRYAYQAEALSEFFDSKEATLDWIRTVQEGPSATPMPDLTLYVQITPEESARRGGVEDDEVFETSDFQIAVKKNYDDLAEMFERYVTIDGMQPPSSVQDDAVDAVMQLVESADNTEE